MAGLRRAIELAIGEEDLAALCGIARSRTEPASRVERAPRSASRCTILPAISVGMIGCSSFSRPTWI